MALCLGIIILPKPQFERARVRSPPSSCISFASFFSSPPRYWKLVVDDWVWAFRGLGDEWCGFLGLGGALASRGGVVRGI